jgi:peptide-methionine (S)-S-oxide reductase
VVVFLKINSKIIREDLYNLIIKPATREYERQLIIKAKNHSQTEQGLKNALEILEAELRPLAIRDNLTPDIADFYQKITHQSTKKAPTNLTTNYKISLKNQEEAIFAGGCFWCMVEPFELKDGIISVTSGYTGGKLKNPSYDQISGGYTDHLEAVKIEFNPKIITYLALLEIYWQLIDPTDRFGQYQDRGSQYRTAIFVNSPKQRQIAEDFIAKQIQAGKYSSPIVTKVKAASIFWPAENYHQSFYKKQKKRYRQIKKTRKRYARIQKIKRRLQQFSDTLKNKT